MESGKRMRVAGLPTPRISPPKLPGPSTKGQAPLNPYLGNTMKVGSLTQMRIAQEERAMLKQASAEEQELYFHMCKLAESGDELELRMLLAQHPELEKYAGLMAAKGFKFLSQGAKRLGNAAQKFLGKGQTSNFLKGQAERAAVTSSKHYGQLAREGGNAARAARTAAEQGSGIGSTLKNMPKMMLGDARKAYFGEQARRGAQAGSALRAELGAARTAAPTYNMPTAVSNPNAAGQRLARLTNKAPASATEGLTKAQGAARHQAATTRGYGRAGLTGTSKPLPTRTAEQARRGEPFRVQGAQAAQGATRTVRPPARADQQFPLRPPELGPPPPVTTRPPPPAAPPGGAREKFIPSENTRAVKRPQTVGEAAQGGQAAAGGSVNLSGKTIEELNALKAAGGATGEAAAAEIAKRTSGGIGRSLLGLGGLFGTGAAGAAVSSQRHVA